MNPEQVRNVRNWPRLKEIIMDLTGQENSWSTIENRLENLRQAPGESMMDYSYRAKTIYNDYLALYGTNQNVIIRQKTAREVAKHFIQKVSNRRMRDVLIV